LGDDQIQRSIVVDISDGDRATPSEDGATGLSGAPFLEDRRARWRHNVWWIALLHFRELIDAALQRVGAFGEYLDVVVPQHTRYTETINTLLQGRIRVLTRGPDQVAIAELTEVANIPSNAVA
jgi:hypothetical protein